MSESKSVLPLRPVGRPRTLDWAQAQRLRDDGLSIKEVAERLGVTPGAIYSATRRRRIAGGTLQTVPERVQEARSLKQQGKRNTEIADYFGVSISTVSNWLAATVCVDCGVPVVRKGSNRCGPCASNNRRSDLVEYWTKDRIIAAIMRFFVSQGRAPTTLDWPTPSEDFPSYNHVWRRFGSFSTAIRTAGLTPKKRGGRGGDRVDRQRSVVARTVANGFSEEEELLYWIEQQEKDNRSGDRVYSISFDSLESRFRTFSDRAYSDSWTSAVIKLVDFRREIDAWANEVAA